MSIQKSSLQDKVCPNTNLWLSERMERSVMSPIEPVVMREIRCCGCNGEKVQARLTNGKEIYHHRKDLYSLPFWKCDACGNFVGCHYKTKNRTQPLGCIPTPELKKARQQIHRLLDPIWQSGKMGRKELYAVLSDRIGWKYHTAQIRSVEEAREIYKIVREYA